MTSTGSLVPTATSANSLKSAINSLKKDFLKNNPSNSIDNIKINIETNNSNAQFANTIQSVLQKLFPDAEIKVTLDKNYKSTGSVNKITLKTTIIGGTK